MDIDFSWYSAPAAVFGFLPFGDDDPAVVAETFLLTSSTIAVLLAWGLSRASGDTPERRFTRIGLTLAAFALFCEAIGLSRLFWLLAIATAWLAIMTERAERRCVLCQIFGRSHHTRNE